MNWIMPSDSAGLITVLGFLAALVLSTTWHGSDLPIVNATAETLFDVLGALLTDGARRQALGRRSRAYVEERHDALKLARQLVQVYHATIERG